MNVEEIVAGPNELGSMDLLAILWRSADIPKGVHFPTPERLSQQLGFMRHPAGHVIKAHTHNYRPRQVAYTQETLVVRSGRIRADLYDRDGELFTSRELRAGDVILLVSGGHGFEVLEECELVEVKQGPHLGANDKTLLEESSRVRCALDRR